MFNNILNEIKLLITPSRLEKTLFIFFFIILSFIILRLLMFIILKTIKNRLSEQINMLVKKVVYYTGITLIVIISLNQLGINITALLGAAGIAGIAVGFAAQTSISNIISGFFLISEKSFELGDLITSGEKTGFVVSIDLLSIKIRTFENLFIRVPNETLIKTELINVTKYPFRRINIDISVAYKEDIKRVEKLLMDIAKNNPLCLNEPNPLFMFKKFGNSGLEILFGVWCIKEDYLKLRNSIMIEIKERFDKENIEIPFPHLTIYKGQNTDSFPIEIKRTKETN